MSIVFVLGFVLLAFTFSNGQPANAVIGQPSLASAATTTTFSTSLGDSVGVGDQLTPSPLQAIQVPLTETATVADSFGQTIAKTIATSLLETMGVTDQQSSSLLQALRVPLTEIVGVGDSVGHSLGKLMRVTLTEAASFVESLGSSLTHSIPPPQGVPEFYLPSAAVAAASVLLLSAIRKLRGKRTRDPGL
jgi:hypothetical protein